MSKLSVVSLGWYSAQSTRMFASRDYKIVNSVKEADIVVFNGGEDIGTSIYGEHPISRYSDYEISERDRMEIDAYNEAVNDGKFLFGICRGAQLFNVLNGGKMWQHVTNHGNDHPLIDLFTGQVLTTTSVHHQMMIPTEQAQIIAVASIATEKFSERTSVKNIPLTKDLKHGADPEILWYGKTRSLCIQGHPEYNDAKFTRYCFEVMDRYIGIGNENYQAKAA